jgi:hypothetical protein
MFCDAELFKIFLRLPQYEYSQCAVIGLSKRIGKGPGIFREGEGELE